MSKSLSRLTAAALAIMAVGGTPAVASAVPADLRSPDARDARAATIATRDAGPVNAPGATAVDSATRPAGPAVSGSGGSAPLPGPPTWPTHPVPVSDMSPPVAADDGGIDWTTIGLGVAGSLVAVGGLALLAGRSSRRRRPQRVHVSA